MKRKQKSQKPSPYFRVAPKDCVFKLLLRENLKHSIIVVDGAIAKLSRTTDHVGMSTLTLEWMLGKYKQKFKVREGAEPTFAWDGGKLILHDQAQQRNIEVHFCEPYTPRVPEELAGLRFYYLP